MLCGIVVAFLNLSILESLWPTLEMFQWNATQMQIKMKPLKRSEGYYVQKVKSDILERDYRRFLSQQLPEILN